MKIDTHLVQHRGDPNDPFHATAAPLYQSATFAQEHAGIDGAFDYSRSGHPTRRLLEEQMATLEGGGRAFAFASGMAALTALLRLLRPGDRVVVGDDMYGGTVRLLERQRRRHGLEVEAVDVRSIATVREALRPPTRLLLVETPTNPRLRIVDLASLAAVCAERGTLLAVDNTLLSPYLQRPLERGADLVLHSATKHLGGHGDLLAGIVIARDDEVADELGFVQNAEGSGLAPFDAWLLLRGIQTLGVRLEREQRTAHRLAEFLARHPAVSRVRFPGLDDHPDRDLHARQARGPGCVISFETASVARSVAVVEGTRLFRTCVSFGGVCSSIGLPGRMSHASISAEERGRRGLPADLVRISVGLEDPEDLREDLARALR